MSSEDEILKQQIKDEWLIRPCQVYIEEYKDCRKIKSRFHQYFIYGKSIDCSQWQRDYKNCKKWIDYKDTKAGEELVMSENKRRLLRLQAHYANDIWEKREKPPEDWNKPLPEHFQNKYENSFLNEKAKEIRQGKVPTDDIESKSICVLM